MYNMPQYTHWAQMLHSSSLVLHTLSYSKTPFCTVSVLSYLHDRSCIGRSYWRAGTLWRRSCLISSSFISERWTISSGVHLICSALTPGYFFFTLPPLRLMKAVREGTPLRMDKKRWLIIVFRNSENRLIFDLKALFQLHCCLGMACMQRCTFAYTFFVVSDIFARRKKLWLSAQSFYGQLMNGHFFALTSMP